MASFNVSILFETPPLFEDMIILVAILPMSFLALSFAGYLCYWHGKMR